jgi:manganese transport protein
LNKFTHIPDELLPTCGTFDAPPARRNGWLSTLGPGALIAVGYMDPGNWATALVGGSRYGYRLLAVIVLASLLAMLLQWIAARVGVVTGRDLAQLCRERSPRWAVIPFWLASEVAIVGCDVAEVVGSAVALQMLLRVPLWLGVLLAALMTMAFFVVGRRGRRRLEIAVMVLIALVVACLAAQLAAVRPDWAAAAQGLAPDPALLRDAGMLWLAAGIVGATVMPHNLYLHSALVKHYAPSGPRKRVLRLAIRQRAVARVLKAVGIGSVASLMLALLVNAALLILAAAVFHAGPAGGVDDLAAAQRLLAPALHARWPGVLFALALLCCGVNSMFTATLAGQAVMEGFLNLRMSRLRRALITRALALGPALLAVAAYGEHGSAPLLVASQVLLSLQLPLAMLPLLRFACDRELMGVWRLGPVLGALAWSGALLLVALNAALAWQWLAG